MRTCSCLVNSCKSPRHYFDESALFTHNEFLRLRHLEIRPALLIGFQPGAVAFVRGQTVESDQPPGYIVGSFMRQEVTDKLSAASGNDASPVLGIILESIALERVDFIADKTGDGHMASGTLLFEVVRYLLDRHKWFG